MHAPLGRWRRSRAGLGRAGQEQEALQRLEAGPRCVPEQQKSCQISVDSGENVSRQSDRQCDRPTGGGSCNLNFKRNGGESAGGQGEVRQLLGNKLSKVVDVLLGLRCLGSTLAMIKCVCRI